MKTLSTHVFLTGYFLLRFLRLLLTFFVLIRFSYFFSYFNYCRYFSFHTYSPTSNYFYSITLPKGFTFLEVMIAFFILAAGTLGAAAMQITAQKSTFNAMQRTVATLYAQSIIGKIKSNSSAPDILAAYEGVFNSEQTLALPSKRCDQVSSNCDAEDRVLSDLYEWNQLLKGAHVQLNGKNVGGLIGAKACIVHHNYQLTVHIVWNSREITGNSSIESTITMLPNSCDVSASLQSSQVVVSTFVY